MFLSQIKQFKPIATISTYCKNALQHLDQRSLIEIKGPEVSEYLQGLITNDIRNLSSGVGSMFTLFLNSKGRILYDVLLYKIDDRNVYWIECDMEVKDMLQKHLKLYRIRRKIDISELTTHKVYALYNSDVIRKEKIKTISELDGNYASDAFPINSNSFKRHDDITIFKDPRLSHLGFRIIANNKNSNPDDYLKNIMKYEHSNHYKKLKYSLGIGEGINDLPIGNSFPLESNCDYLHGISFSKGCYVGQELTARSHHTGVIRKRLMPLLFTVVPKNLPENNVIIHNKINLGKLRGIEGDVGLALLRIEQALDLGDIKIGDGEARVIKPDWWPNEGRKEKINVI